jgi:hypothetical protein
LTGEAKKDREENPARDNMGGELEALRRNSDRRSRRIKQHLEEAARLLTEQQSEIDSLTKRNASTG